MIYVLYFFPGNSKREMGIFLQKCNNERDREREKELIVLILLED